MLVLLREANLATQQNQLLGIFPVVRVTPPSDKAEIRELGDGIELAYPNKKNWLLVGFTGLWVLSWLAGGSAVALELLDPASENPEEKPFVALWLMFWLTGGLLTSFVVLWMLFGLETVKFTQSTIQIRKHVLGVGHVREYDAEYIARLRAEDEPMNVLDFRASLRFWGIGGGTIAFDYGASVIRFGSALELPEAKRHVDKILRRFSRFDAADA